MEECTQGGGCGDNAVIFGEQRSETPIQPSIKHRLEKYKSEMSKHKINRITRINRFTIPNQTRSLCVQNFGPNLAFNGAFNVDLIEFHFKALNWAKKGRF